MLIPLCLITGCNNTGFENETIEHETEFGGVYIHRTIDEFNKLGFAYGDSVDVSFSNGYTLKELPYYNGYYVDAGQPLLVAYPGYPYIKVTLNYGDDIWEIAKLNENDKASIKLNKKGQYLDVQNSSDIHYYDEREKYPSDEIFANFRNIKVGDIKEGILYRSASPCDNKHKRASYVDKLMEKAGVNFILNLADTKEKIDGYIAQEDFNSPYFLSLYEKEKFFLSFAQGDKVEPVALNMNYTSKDFAKKMAAGLKHMANSDGPYLIHCLEGKDRTGFICIVLEALLGASYQEIVDDYMLTYDNYYEIDKNDKRYEVIKKRNVDSMLVFISGSDNYANIDLIEPTRQYLKNMGELEDKDIDLLIEKLGK